MKRKLGQADPPHPKPQYSLTVGDEELTDLQRMHLFVSAVDWPERTDEPCLYCQGPFDTFPYGMPTAYNAKLCKYEAVGFFCTIGCMWSYTRRDQPHLVNLVETFIRSAHGLARGRRSIPEAAPLEKLCKLRAELKNDKEAYAVWRTPDPKNVLRKVPGIFVRAAQAYEEQTLREHQQQQHARHLELMESQKPKPVVLTSVGQQEQMKFVKQSTAAAPKKKPKGAIDFMLRL